MSRYDGEKWTTYKKQDGFADDFVHALLQDDSGALWFGTDNGGVSRYDGEQWETYTTEEGLASNTVSAIMQDKEGAIWFGTLGGGVSRLDTRSWIIYTQANGLASNKVSAITQDVEGQMWFGTLGGGVSRYDGKNWTTYTRRDGLRADHVSAIQQDKTGAIWFGKPFGGISRFDGQNWTTYTGQDRFAPDRVSAILQDRDGAMWFATGNPMRSGGVRQYDGKEWRMYTQADGLADNTVSALFQDRDGAIWFGTGNRTRPGNGVSRFDGKNWVTYTTADGLGHNTVLSIFQDRRDGAMWFGTDGDGVSRFDGKNWMTYTTADGLGSNYISAILQDEAGVIWFGTHDGGVSRYDGQSFMTIDSRDGLPNDTVTCLYMDRSGTVWGGTLGGGVIRFMPSVKVQPPIAITRVVADTQAYYAPGEYLKLPAGRSVVFFSFHAISFRTRPGRMHYHYQLVGKESNWQKPTNREEVEYLNLKPGDYTFQVQAIDRDLNTSDLATVRITIPTPFYTKAGFLVPIGGAGLLLFATLILLAIAFVKYRGRISDYQKAAVAELRDAREMQLSLLPAAAPKIEGFDIAGACEPATEVGGDYFTYLWLDDAPPRPSPSSSTGRAGVGGGPGGIALSHSVNGGGTQLGIVLMDVTGHGMKAATTTFLANGMLQSESRSGSPPNEIMAKMHHSLQEILPKRAFVAMSFAHINLRDKTSDGIGTQSTLTHFNAALPEPILLREGRPVELPIRNEVPLGCPLPAEYVGTTIPLHPGDVLLLFSDGLPEARDASGQEYEKIRLGALLSSLMSQQKSAQAWVDAILTDVREFTAPGEPEDDMTVVVVKVL
ncbi:SpoIIE family protein phosphatase [Candidatus Poribacteria bacterium]|nr:SpoIIE family protein phosphatase [Candidatus Poribacteria bacterium]